LAGVYFIEDIKLIKDTMLNKICTDLETSKRLEELGIEGETCFYAVTYLVDNVPQFCEFYCYLLDGEFYNEFGTRATLQVNGYCRAYTLEQILEMLPMGFFQRFEGIGDSWTVFKMITDVDNVKGFEYISIMTKIIGEHAKLYSYKRNTNDNLATTAARLLIKLKEDRII